MGNKPDSTLFNSTYSRPIELVLAAAGFHYCRATAQRAVDFHQQARYKPTVASRFIDSPIVPRRTVQLAIAEACRQGSIPRSDGQYRLPL